MMTRILSCALICALTLPTICLAAPYSITDLGRDSYAQSINNSGQVVGSTLNGTFLYSGGVLQDDLGTGFQSSANGINNLGQIVGSSRSFPGADSDHAFLYSGGTMHDLDTLGVSASVAYSINDFGQVVGTIEFINYTHHAFLYSDGAMQDLGTFGGENSYATGINNLGQVVGFAQASDGGQHTFVYSGGIMHTLASPADGLAYAINDAGQLTGVTYVGGLAQAFLYSGGIMHNLGSLGGTSYGSGINDSGQVVGVSYAFIGNNSIEHAFLYSGTTMWDLNNLVDPSSDWVLIQARAINHNGQITGYGTFDGQEHAFLLTPIPEPSSFVLAALAAIGLAALTWRRRA